MSQIPASSWCPAAVRVSPESAPAPVGSPADRAAPESGRWEFRPPRPEHPVGWYRTMEPLFAHEHFGFPTDARPGMEWTASDGSEWTYELNLPKTWEMSKYPPEPPLPVDPALIERVEHARLWNAVASALTAFCAENGYPRPYFSARNRVATRVWRELHPDSSFDDGPADGDPAGPLRRGRKPETPEGSR